MLKRQNVKFSTVKKQCQLVMLACLGAVTVTAAQADDKTNLDRVLNQLNRQHNNASDLIKSSRQPASLAFDSQLLAKASDTSRTSTGGDVLERLSAVASNSVSNFQQSGVASWYGRQFNGRKTASGEIFNQDGFTAAHRSLPLNCYVKVTNKSNGKSVVVKVNDRGPFHANRVLDLSYGAAKQIGLTSSGTGNVSIERVAGPS